MTRDDWLDQFIDELHKLRPHAGDSFAPTLALQHHSDRHPRTAAREYDRRQETLATPAAPASAKKRAK